MASVDHLMQRHLSTGNGRCECGAIFDASYLRMVHLRVEHLIKAFICLRCRSLINDLGEMAEHFCES